MDLHPDSEHEIAVMLPWILVYRRCLPNYLEPYVGSNVAGQEGHFTFSRDTDEVGDVDGGDVGGDIADGLFNLLVWLVGGVEDRDGDGDNDGTVVYLDLSMRFVGEMGDMNDVIGVGGDGVDGDFEGITMSPVGDTGQIGAEVILIKPAVTLGDIGEESTSDGAVVVDKTELALLFASAGFV